jgi:hypothetical protein
MIEHHLDIPTADGAMNSFLVHPDEGGPHPVVLFYMDAPGKREELHDMARRIAAVGYCSRRALGRRCGSASRAPRLPCPERRYERLFSLFVRRLRQAA